MIFFDLDGTLHHQELSESQAAAALRRETAAFHSLPEEQFVSAWAELAEHYFNRHLAGEFTFAEQRRSRVQAVGERCGVVISDDACVQIFSVFLKAYEDNWTLYPEVPNCLAALIERGAALGIITNGEAKQQRNDNPGTLVVPGNETLVQQGGKVSLKCRGDAREALAV
jgi:putative hydrolase of the HAD superfamily